ncbi:MAG TPA: CoB--CoM heterodisulfide reductase iron-sulfur subunit A family protein [Patescibacteria group bacterium]|nr:CoB--CoM heterodisulfide reductase iron-sulfur subunit A family protein [Patescibacteria group bacterium]
MSKVGAVMVVGGGIAGIQASLDLADSGFKVYLVEKEPSIGGVMTQLDKTFPTNDCAMCILAPKLVGAGRHPNIELITYADLRKVEGEDGDFKVTLNKRAMRVDPDKCTGCGICAQKCPASAIDEYNEGLSERKGVFIRYSQAVPLVFTIDKDRCLGCGICSEVCKAEAIRYDEEDSEVELEVGSIILAPGFEEFDPSAITEYGYGRYPNVVTSIEFERILSATGPFRGTVLRPSDGELPGKVAFIQCVGSRDERAHSPYCSGVCCMYSIKEAVIAKEHNPSLEPTIFFMDVRAFGKEFDDYYSRAEEEHGVRFVRSRVSHTDEEPNTNDLYITYVEDGEVKKELFDMVVLSVGLRPPADAEKLAGVLGFELNEHGFCKTGTFTPLDTTRPGVYVCGAFASPKDIPDSVAQASGAASRAQRAISSVRGSMITGAAYPAERSIEGEEPRVGVFVCHCGINIGGVVDVPEVVEYAKTLPGVAYTENNLYTCSQDTQEKIKGAILENHLNRVIVASCTPRTHEPLFRATLQEAGLNPYLFEMANIRDQCSWVHMHQPREATEKAKDLVRMAVAKARLLQPLDKPLIDVTQSALVVGGGLSGMTAALELADQGVEVHLVEREDDLGGNLRKIRFTLEGVDPQAKLGELVGRIQASDRIHVHTDAEVADIQGHIGNFESTLLKQGNEEVVHHGVVIVATGGTEYEPSEYLYGQNGGVMTQLELESKIADEGFKPETVVMIQCVGSRCDERPYCSRICCSDAVKNALKLKEVNPSAEVYVIYKDMRTYGFKEDYYREAARQGVLFIRYDDEHKPDVSDEGELRVKVFDPVLKERVLIEPDAVVLSAGVIPPPDNPRLAGMLKVPLSKDGFFLEAHMKLRPLDFATDGIFLCGLAHGPKSIDESISQACGAAARAMTILSKETLETEGAIARVDEDLCSGCRMCEGVCEFNAVEMVEEEGKAHSSVREELCKGCGVCASTCPSGAITIGHFTDDEILSQVRAALQEART